VTGIPPPERSNAGALSPADWAQLESVVDALLDTPPERRAALLAEVSGGDATRRAELERLVAECERPHPLLDQPAAKRFAALVDEQAVRVSALLADRYRITREIGRGGMATVYLAHDVRHSRDVAVKVLRPELAAALGGGRFLREIEIAARLRHPNIVPVYDSGESDGILYYVMPYEAGHSLRERLAREGPLGIGDAVVVLRDVGDALAHAHRHGVVHRDVKPDNVLLAGRHAMVTDFGVAKAISAAEGAADRPEDPPGPKDLLTTAGVSLGTPAYMAPEQIAADPRIDHRADIYALGVLAYEMLAGHPPFRDAESQLILAAHLTQAPEPIAAHRADAPPVLADLVMKCLEKRPVDRWQSADEIISCLESLGGSVHSGEVAPAVQVASGGSHRAMAASPSRLRRTVVIASATAAVAALGTVAIVTARRRAEPALPLDPAKLVVVPFRTTGLDSSLQHLAEGVADLLAAKLTGDGEPIAVESRTAISAWHRVRGHQEGTADDARQVARMLGAATAVSGTLVGVPGNRLTITANVLSPGAARPAVTVTGQVDSLSSLLDVLALRIAAGHAGVSEPTLATIATVPMPALRAYFWGRAAYRRGREAEAVRQFARAVDIDSTFALAALDLAVALGQPLGYQPRCPGNDCLTTYFALGYRNAGSESDHRRVMRAVNMAWHYREKLGPRDRPLAEALRGDSVPERNTARAMIARLQSAATAAPDRAETQFLLGSLLLYQGRAVELVDSRARAAAAYRRALEIDPEYAAPMAGLVEVAAFERDTAELRRAGARYLAHDSTGAMADYIRWRVAAVLGDASTLASIRARLDSLDASSLQRIAHASVMSGTNLADAERAISVVIGRASDRVERRIALAAAYSLAMNRGRPQDAVALLRRRSMEEDDVLSSWTWATMSAMFWGGDTTIANEVVKNRIALITRDTLAALRDTSRSLLVLSRHVSQQGMWDLMHGDTARATAAIRWLRINNHPLGADFVSAIMASQSRSPDADAIRARLDSVALEGCCNTVIVNWANLVVARAHEAAGRDADALRAVRRGVWRFPPQLLSTFLREEGRLAAKVGDRDGAIRAYRHYLALRSDPEPELRPEVDRVRTELARLERGR